MGSGCSRSAWTELIMWGLSRSVTVVWYSSTDFHYACYIGRQYNFGIHQLLNIISILLDTMQDKLILGLCCHTRPILEFQLDWKSGKSQLARWATEWHYNHSASQPATQPASQPATQPTGYFDLYVKVKYFNNHWLDFAQILNLSSGDQTKIKNDWNEDDLQWKTTSKY